VLVLSAFLMVVMMFVCAVAMDLGYIFVSRVEAQRAADAAAMAATWKLTSEEYARGANTAEFEQAARATAADYVDKNPVAGVRCQVDMNSSNSTDGDVVLGRLDDPSDSDSFVATPVDGRYNAVRVRVRRDSSRNGRVPLFFAAVLGTNDADITAQATAMFRDNINGFRVTNTSQKCSLMPFVVHESTWEDWLDGAGDDSWGYDPDTKAVSSGGDGIREFTLFADGNNGGGNNGKKKNGNNGNGAVAPGNFGTVDIGNPNNAAPDLWRQIRNGPNATDFAYHGGEIALGPSGTLLLNGDTGITASMKHALADIVGQPRTIMIYREVNGNGNNAYFTITGFVGVRLVDFSMTGSDKYLCVQPAMCFDNSSVATYSESSSWFLGQPVQLVR
jgi:hypothetical protein